MTTTRAMALVAAACAMLASAEAGAQTRTTAVENTSGSTSSTVWNGQSFTLPGDAQTRYSGLTFSFINSAGNTAVGNGYLFSSAYNGTPTSLAAAGTSEYISKVAGANGVYTFDPNMSFAGGTQLWVYADARQTIAFNPEPSNAYAGGAIYRASATGNSYSIRSSDAAFRVTAFETAAAAPEPAAWALMILGFGVVGGTLRQRRRVEGRDQAAIGAS